jgi:DNA helicase-2/ATP-dependent DNA helicase PcrA
MESRENVSLSYFLEDVALATDFDKEKDDKPRVSLMTIHLAKGLEFPYVYIVGLEENLFPSAMSMNTRSEIEEERRLFYVALTRAEQQVYLSYADSRYRWGKLIDCEPSRFIEEIDENFIHFEVSAQVPKQLNKFVDEDIFGSVPQDRIRFKKPVVRKPVKPSGKVVSNKKTEKPKAPTPKNLVKISKAGNQNTNLFDAKLTVGNIVEHSKFGKGEVLKIEGSGNDAKALIHFTSVGQKNLLLRFAKLKILG